MESLRELISHYNATFNNIPSTTTLNTCIDGDGTSGSSVNNPMLQQQQENEHVDSQQHRIEQLEEVNHSLMFKNAILQQQLERISQNEMSSSRNQQSINTSIPTVQQLIQQQLSATINEDTTSTRIQDLTDQIQLLQKQRLEDREERDLLCDDLRSLKLQIFDLQDYKEHYEQMQLVLKSKDQQIDALAEQIKQIMTELYQFTQSRKDGSDKEHVNDLNNTIASQQLEIEKLRSQVQLLEQIKLSSEKLLSL
jgi:chromosome segregation ATPase